MQLLALAAMLTALTLTAVENRMIRRTGHLTIERVTPQTIQVWGRARFIAISALVMWSLTAWISFTHGDYFVGMVAAATTISGVILYAVRGYARL